LLSLGAIYREMGDSKKADEAASEAVVAARKLVDMSSCLGTSLRRRP
jgi:hypothetical protein